VNVAGELVAFGRDHRAGFNGLVFAFGAASRFSEPSPSERFPAIDFVGGRLPVISRALPFVGAIGDDEAAALLVCRAEAGFRHP